MFSMRGVLKGFDYVSYAPHRCRSNSTTHACCIPMAITMGVFPSFLPNKGWVVCGNGEMHLNLGVHHPHMQVFNVKFRRMGCIIQLTYGRLQVLTIEAQCCSLWFELIPFPCTHLKFLSWSLGSWPCLLDDPEFAHAMPRSTCGMPWTWEEVNIWHPRGEPVLR